MVKLDVQRSAQCANGNGLIEPAVLESQVVEEAKRLPGEPAQLVMVAFGLQFTDDDQWHDHLVFGEPRTRPRVREQDRGVEHVRPGGRVQFGHRRSFGLAGLWNPLADSSRPPRTDATPRGRCAEEARRVRTVTRRRTSPVAALRPDPRRRCPRTPPCSPRPDRRCRLRRRCAACCPGTPRCPRR